MKEINPRLLELASKTGNEELAERERRIREENERQKRRSIEQLIDVLKVYSNKLEKEEIRHKEIQKYLKNLEKAREVDLEKAIDIFVNHPDFPVIYKKAREVDLEKAIDIFVNHPDFPIIYNQVNSITDARYRDLYILKKAEEIGREINIPLLQIASSLETSIKFKKALEEYGIYILCPYFEANENKNPTTGQLCHIEGEEIWSLCQGKHYDCVVFARKSKEAAEGIYKLPKFNRPALKKQIPKMKVDPVDLEDLEDWSRSEGKYDL